MRDGIALPTLRIIALLMSATDAPTLPKSTTVDQDKLPGFFRKWVSTAWGEMIDKLPDEDAAALGNNAPARDEFHRLVREAMLSEIVLGDVIGKSGVTQTERRSLIDWCQKFGKSGPWRSIRSKKCWCKYATKGDGGEIVLQVAIRHELFAQVGADKRLREMGATRFTRRAVRYGVGTSPRDDRPHGQRAVILDPDFVADLIATIPDDDTDEATQEFDQNEKGK